MTRRPFRFGVIAGPTATRREWVEAVRRAESLGYSIWLASDHFAVGLAPIPALSVAAELTSIRVGTLVAANDFRHPAVLAKEAATLDLLTSGRFELGLGTGWLASDYSRSGIELDAPEVRVSRLREAIRVTRGLWSGEEFSHRGRHYQVQMRGLPEPVQSPHPPILVGGSGPSILRLAAQEAQIVSVTATVGQNDFEGFWSAVVRSGEGIADRIRWIREARGERELPEINVLIHHLEVTSDRTGVAAQIGASVSTDPLTVLESPHLLIGSIDEITATLVERRDRFGISYVVVGQESMQDFAPVVQRLADT